MSKVEEYKKMIEEITSEERKKLWEAWVKAGWKGQPPIDYSDERYDI